MKQFLAFVRKEFAHILRDRKTLVILFGLPVSQILIYGFALTKEVKNSKIMVVDHARDEQSRKLTEKLDASTYFEVEYIGTDTKTIPTAFQKGRVKMAVVLPANFGYDLHRQKHAQVQLITDGSDPNLAAAIKNYAAAIILDYQRELNTGSDQSYQILPKVKMLYNPQLKDAHNFVPGVMALVLMLVCVMMTSIAIVKEKETGTMEVLLISSFKPLMVIATKAFPYLVLSLVNVVIILLLSLFLLDLPVNGSLLLLFFESAIFIIASLALGILISILTSSQQVAMLISLMGLLIPTILFSGFMFPIENMPYPLQLVANIIPAKWFYTIVQSIMIKGLGITGIWKETLVLFSMTIFFVAISLKSFKIRLQ